MKKYILYIIAMVAMSCGAEDDGSSIVCRESNIAAITNSFVCELGEEVRYQPRPQRMKFVDKSHFVILSLIDPTVYMYNISGEQLHAVGSVGRSRSEYLFPSSAAVHDNNIYLSCVQSKKIIAYDINGKFINQIDNFKARCRDFVVTDDYIYRSGTVNNYIEVSSTKDGDLVGYMGDFGEADKVLNSWSWTNVICEYQDGVLYMSTL